MLTPQQVDNANQSRIARDNLRLQHPDGGVRSVANTQGGRRFTWGRFTTAFNAPVSMLRVGIHISGTGNFDPALVQALLERAQLAVDLHFNQGGQLLSGDWMMVDLVPVSDPAAADMTIDLDPANLYSTPTDADLDTLTALLREQLGLPPNGTDMDVNDLRELSNSIARANTPATLEGLPGTRVEGPQALDSLEHAQYQHDVEDALRHGNQFLVGADPRTNDYGHLINDGGPTEQGRSNNCLDGSLAALSSFNGRPEVGSPRWPDLDADGDLDTRSGEEHGIDRATAWLGGTWQRGDTDQAVSAQFQTLHDQIRGMGPGASALVVNTWHARDPDTGELLYEPDGSPTIDGSHATVIVYPHGAAGPVWWDPQTSAYSDTPPHYLTSATVELWSMPVDTQGVANAGSTAGHQGTSAAIPSGSVPDPDILGDRVQPRVGVPTGTESGTENSGPGTRPDELRPQQADRGSDSAPESAPVDDRRDVRPGDRDRPAGERPTDLPQTPTGEFSTPDRERRDNHVPGDSDVAGQPSGATRDLPAGLQQTIPETGPARTNGLAGELESAVAQPPTEQLADSRDDRGLADQSGYPTATESQAEPHGLAPELMRGDYVAPDAPESREAVAPEEHGDIRLDTGDHVYLDTDLTSVGYDRMTSLNRRLTARLDGYHDVVVHGNDRGFFMPGSRNAAGVDFPVGEVHPTHLAEAIRNKPSYSGQPIRLISCHSGRVRDGLHDVPAAQQLANALGGPVMAPTDEVGIYPNRGEGQQPEVQNGGYWRVFLPVIE
ncbi:toxin glutamine deamidase domain-containing protein [Nocardia fluminea]|uniref:toxin glutamine deamidase domain-containing protein n=1 Tax=Nocardia fluminea TaxID=134984 RepID=UPI003659A8F8